VFVGGKFGRSPSLGKPVLGTQRTIDDALAVVTAVLDFFRRHGRAKERFNDTLSRTGFAAIETHLREATKAA
jgi:dissimilatory sulfite reductase (desulfoviridin) alpha/beta subunit